MRFGLVKFCSPIDFDVLNSTSNSGVDDRYGFIKELVNRGHSVTIFSPLIKGSKNNPKEERWITNQDLEVPKELKFIRKLGYVPGELPVGEFKVDIMIADAGVGSMAFPDNYHSNVLDGDPESSLIRRFIRVIGAHTGPVMYLHNDPSLPFYFRQMAGRKYPWGHPNNGYTNPDPKNRGEKWVRDSAWGTHDEIFANKQSIVITRCLPSQFEYMIDNYDTDRAGYKEYAKHIHFEYLPPAYDYDLCDGIEYSEKIEYPLFYSGGDRRRRIAFRRFYEDMDIPTYVSGKWDEKAMVTFDNINFMGWLEDRQALLDTINKAGCVVQVQPKDAAKMGWWTARTMEVPACRAMCFIDGSIKQSSDFVFDSWFVLNSKFEAMCKMKAFLGLSLKDRIKIIETQLAYCKTNFTWSIFVDGFISLCHKYIDKKTTRTVREERKDFLNDIFSNIDLTSIKEIIPFDPITSPGMTDLMISPEEIEKIDVSDLPNTTPFLKSDIPMSYFIKGEDNG